MVKWDVRVECGSTGNRGTFAAQEEEREATTPPPERLLRLVRMAQLPLVLPTTVPAEPLVAGVQGAARPTPAA